MVKKRKKIKRHLKWKPFFLLLACIILIYLGISYYLNTHVKHIEITGTTLIKDVEILEKTGLKEYPKMTSFTSFALEKKIKENPLVEDVKVKKNLFGKVSIKIKEAYVLFYNRNNSAYVLSNGKETIDQEYVGIPFLNNYVPQEIYERLIKDLNKVSQDALSLVSEIEYAPSMSGDITIDDTRFLLKMNDGNQVHINLIHIDRLNIYDLTYTTIPNGEKGILEMDSDNDRGYWHKFEEPVPEEPEELDEEGDADEDGLQPTDGEGT